jgi:ElaB/YqjD/DUF883 family membrane-anchored ribosome-binding protein
MSQTRAAKDQLVQDMNAVMSDSEQLLRSAASDSSDKARSLRSNLEKSLSTARARLSDFQDAAKDQVMATANDVDDYVKASPWQAIGIAAGVGVLVGAILAMASNRD